ncbi:hypothetical protein SteCoe_28487 [Stentor coeruleus]|uniref:Sugar transporter SWEET1 n=1 Tax=Stentor coeruleus TaxID=5963 RepID=A0A1R2B862_9CILI|nr:hypothetical protein SteCoe_28487 [Stentor coeruleus]
MDCKLLLSVLGIIISVGNALTPSIVIHSRRKTEDIYQVPSYYLRINHFSSISWLLYSIYLLDIGLIVVNTLTSVLTFVSIFIFAYYTSKLWEFYIQYLVGLLVVGSLCLSALIVKGLGVFCTILNVATFLANLESIQQIISTSNYTYIDLRMGFSNLISGSIWLAYGIFIQNLSLIISNAVLVAVSTVLLSFHTYYRIFRKNRAYF